MSGNVEVLCDKRQGTGNHADIQTEQQTRKGCQKADK